MFPKTLLAVVCATFALAGAIPLEKKDGLTASDLFLEAKANVVIAGRKRDGLTAADLFKEAKADVVISNRRGLTPAEILAEAHTNVVQDRELTEAELFSEANTDVLQNGK